MTIEAKICGISTPEAVEALAEGGAGYIGFIFFPKSPRHVSAEQAAELASLVPSAIKKVAVTVNADNDYLDEICAVMQPDIMQLHGAESTERVLEVMHRYGLPVMKAFAIREAGDFEKVKAYEGIADRFLFDAKPPVGSDLPGGNGVSFDWNLLKDFETQTPWMLSGGLDAGNIEVAVQLSGASTIDVSSGVEDAPGVKNTAKIAALLTQAAKIRV